ncbi:MAG: hypothetical protein V3V98_04220 [Thermoplasmata archaeon]
MSEDVVTISAKVKKDFQNRLDQIGKELGVTNRSNIIRSGLEYFVDAYDLGRIPAIFPISKEDDGSGQLRTKVSVYPGMPPHRAIKSEETSGDSR